MIFVKKSNSCFEFATLERGFDLRRLRATMRGGPGYFQGSLSNTGLHEVIKNVNKIEARKEKVSKLQRLNSSSSGRPRRENVV